MRSETMTSVLVQLTPEIEKRLRQQANGRGESLETYLRFLVEKEAGGASEVADNLTQGLIWLTKRGAEEIQAAQQRILQSSPPPRELPAGKTLIDMVEGKWPGSETDAEIREALDRMS
jgi:hypothetical protein